MTGYSYLSTQIQVTCPPRQYGQQKKCNIYPFHAFVYSNGTMNDLGTLGGTNSKGLSINRSGQVVGWADTKTGLQDSFLWNGADHGFLYSNGAMTDLGLNFFPAAISGNAVIVGGNLICSGGILQNLNNLIPGRIALPGQRRHRDQQTTARSSPTPATPPQPNHALLLTPN